MRYASPLRYPGGKAAMTNLLRQIRHLNGLNAHVMAEPFGGGAGASLTLLYLEETHSIQINDADQSIYDFWWSATHRAVPFMQKLMDTPVSLEEWSRQRDIYRSTGRVSRLERGFATFYLNRCNRSGIIPDGSVIGGRDQAGAWQVGARFNKSGLLSRLRRLSDYRTRIEVSGIDALKLFDRLDPVSTFFFIDPPYFQKGETLYLNAIDPDYHATIAKRLCSMSETAWVLTYDDCPQVRAMYADWASVRPFSLRYSAGRRRNGRELLITPRWMKLPDSQSSNAINW